MPQSNLDGNFEDLFKKSYFSLIAAIIEIGNLAVYIIPAFKIRTKECKKINFLMVKSGSMKV